MISNKQRNMAYGLMRTISNEIGYCDKEVSKGIQSIKDKYKEKVNPTFSLYKECKKKDFNVFMGWLLDLSFYMGVHFEKEHPRQFFLDNMDGFFAICIKNKKCCICGKDADLHHVDKVGMGNNREEIDHSQYRRMALCRTHHTESHTIGETTFQNKYHVWGVKCNYHNKIDSSESLFIQAD